MIRDLRKLKEDDDVKAVVLRVNSPGGSAFASEQIWHAVKELKAKKPVIVSMATMPHPVDIISLVLPTVS